MKKWIPLTITLIFAAWILSSLAGPRDPENGPPLVEFGQLPVVNDGRNQPMDSLARNALLIIRKKQTLNTEPWKGNFDKPVILPAIHWMMELMMDAKAADDRPVFRVDNSDLKNLFHLPMEPDEKAHVDGKHYSWNQITPYMETFRAETQRASALKSELRNAYERSLMDLWEASNLYKTLRGALGVAAGGDLAVTLPVYRQKVKEAGEAVRLRMEGQPFDAEALEWGWNVMQLNNNAPLVIPPHGDKAIWSKALEEITTLKGDEAPHYALIAYGQMASAWQAKDWGGLKKIIEGYDAKLNADPKLGKEMSKAKSEQWFNHIELFYKGMIVAVLAFLLAAMTWFSPGRFEWCRKTAVWLMTLVLVILATGVIWRMHHEGRPPVTNLYSSALFIGIAATIIGLVLELFWPFSIGVAVASVLSFKTLLVAHYLSLDGDTMIMLRAVLDTNFWLATHVVIVTLGYASTFVAGFIGGIYVFRGVLTPHVSKKMERAFASMVFAIICFASLFSFVGTVLGGIWADQSWGRFWGWDPKENGALIIVLWNVMILHARLGGLVKERGLINLAIGGNIVTSWSWFGTNMLGIGLHSYGFMDAAQWTLIGFVVGNAVLMLIGCLPKRMWRSFMERDTPAGLPAAEAPGPEKTASAV